MKKTILAVITSSLLASAAHAAVVYDKDGQQVDVYGRAEYDIGQIENNDNGDAQNFGGTGTARVGFNGKWATDYDVSLISKLEWQFKSEQGTADSQEDVTSRYAWLGFDFGNGVQLTFGHMDSAYVELGDVTDIANWYSGNDEYGMSGIGSRWNDAAKVTYQADGWDVRAAVSFDDSEKLDEETSNSATERFGYANATTDTLYSAAVGYTFQIDDVQSIKPIIAYQGETGKVDGVGDYDVAQYALGVGYTYDAFYFGTTYGQARYHLDNVDEDTQKDTIFTVSTSYKVMPDVTLLAGFAQIDPHNGADNGVESRPTGSYGKYYWAGAQYNFTPTTKAYVEYKFSQGVVGGDDHTKFDNNYDVGLQYNF